MKFKISKPILIPALILLIAILNINLLTAQTLSISNKKPKIDGTIEKGEYSLKINIKDGFLYLSRDKNYIYVAVKAKTNGWVALGFNSSRMNNADIIIGYATQDKSIIKLQKGIGHRHKDSGISYIEKRSIKEKGDFTILEAQLKSGKEAKSLVIKNGKLPVIVAYGSSDNLKSYHKYRKSVIINLSE